MFLTDDFLLLNEAAKVLYHNYAKEQPIIDYHCHLNPEDVSSDKQFENLTDIWLRGDHYKWRAMRSMGIDEKYITGDASDYEKFLKWAECVPKTIGNPLYHWTHLELRRPFGITDRVLNPETAPGIWEEINEKLKQPEFSARGIMKQMGVETICTTDDPADTLEFHKTLLEEKDSEVSMFPTFRPDKAVAIEDIESYLTYLKSLEKVSGKEITSYEMLLEVLKDRHDFFHEMGCRLSDHALTTTVYEESLVEEIEEIFSKVLSGHSVSDLENKKFKTALLQFFGRLNAAKGWVMQIHIGALRNNNSRMFSKLGADTGFDSINDGPIAAPLSKLLNSLDITNELPKTILYVLNPSDNDVIATMIGNFQDGSVAGKIQFGSGWWFNDQKRGMEDQMVSLANMGILSKFVGMLTDSRSFLSYTRHEYFRRILCNILGTWITNGEAPEDYALLGEMVRDICYTNSKTYFNFNSECLTNDEAKEVCYTNSET